MSGADRGDQGLHAFGRWRFDAGTGDLSDAKTTTRLEPQVAKLLTYFLTHQDTLVSRDELLADVWDHRIVSDDAINRCISILRQTLSPDDKNAYIETVVRRGFISHFPPALAESPSNVRRSRRRNPWLLGGALAGVTALIAFGVFRMLDESLPQVGTAARTGVPMIAVLPFVSSGLPGDSEFFASGMHDDLLTQLAQLQSMRVISRTSVYQYRGSDLGLREIGRELGADAILEGGVQRVGDRIRINVQLIDAHSDVHLWAQQYDRKLAPANIFDIQAEIARSIASALDSTLTKHDAAQLNVLPTQNMAAYRAYHEAMALREAETIGAPASVAALERAVSLDPEFVRAWAELAGAIGYRKFAGMDPDSTLRLESLLERIRALAPQSSEYLIAQAYYTYYVLERHARALEMIQQARRLRPSDVQVLELQSWIQRRLGDFDGMIETIRQTRTLDPRNPYWTVRLVSNLMITHRYDEAIVALENSRVESLELSVLRSLLRVREHREPGRLLGDLAALQEEYGTAADPFDLWEAHVAGRDFAGAAAHLDALQAAEPSTNVWTFSVDPDIDLARLITEWFVDGHPDRLGPRLVEVRAKLEHAQASGVRFVDANRHLAIAFVAAIGGHTAETERLIRVWQREISSDQATLAVLRHYACRALGIAAAAPAAVECLRSALAEPSQAIPFIEPFLPYYDSLRSDPGFVDLLAGM